MQTPEFQRQLESIEGLINQIESAGDEGLISKTKQLVQVVMDLHGAGLDRMLELIRATGDPGQELIDRLGQDNLVSSLLVLHEIHPRTFEDRIKQSVEAIVLRGTDVELVSIEGGAVRLRVYNNGSKTNTRVTIEEALNRSAPDLTSLAIEGLNDRTDFVPLQVLSNPKTGRAFCD